MTMRWRSSTPSANETTGAMARKETQQQQSDDLQEEQQQTSHDATSTSATSSTASRSSPLVGNDDEGDGADSSLSASNTAMSSVGSSIMGAQQQQQRQQTRADMTTIMDASDSAIDPSGDPPYENHAQQQQAGIDQSAGSAHDLTGDSGGRLATGAQSAHSLTSGPPDLSGGDKDIDNTESLPALEAASANMENYDDAGDDQEVPWKPQATQSTCEFTHTITNYSQKRDSGCKKAEYSATTVDEFGNRWRLIVYVNGNGRASNHHLSLFLQVADADDLPFGWKKAVSYVLTLEHPTGPNLSYAKRNPDKTFKLCPKAIDWGWSQFITSDRIQQEGFVQDDSLVVRASVTVKSSSVSIDLEDAELYLKCAVEEGKPEAVQLCLDQGASVNCQFKDDLYTPLHTACSSSTGDDDEDDDDEDEFDDEDDELNKKRNEKISGSMRVLQLLLEMGADGNACNKWRETPLLIAANNGHRSAVEALLKHGADPSLCSEAGWSALTFAAHKGYDDIVLLLLKAGAPVNCRVTEDASTPLHKACAGSKLGHLAAVRLLLGSDADVHALNKWRETPLLTAANHGQAGAVNALLKAGADPCKCTDTGWSPLSIAAYKGHDDVVKLLLEEGAPTEEADPTLSALLQAATKGLPDTVELLLKHGADHTVTTKKGDTALSILVEQNLIDAAVDMVTEYNASIPRCSRDRKKVQRARLLINLRIKQRQREGKHINLVESDDEEDESDLEMSLESGQEAEIDSTAAAQHGLEEIGDSEANGLSSKSNKKKKNKKKKKMTAEQQAKAAEEALLLELEQEDAERQKQEQEASKKSAKKRKKKERERQQKKEQEEKRLAEEKEREEQLQKQREEKEAKERAERERLLAIRRKEEEEERQRLIEKQKREEEQRRREQQKRKQQQQQQQEKLVEMKPSQQQPTGKPGKRQGSVASSAASRASSNTARTNPAMKSATQVKANSSIPSKSSAQTGPRPMGKNRGWETTTAMNAAVENKPTPPKTMAGLAPQNNVAGRAIASASSTFRTPQRESTPPIDLFSSTPSASPFGRQLMNPPPAPGPPAYTKSEPILNGFSPASFPGHRLETPAVALFRRDKVTDLFRMLSLARASGDILGVVDELTIKKVLYRWMVRAAHEKTNYLDCVIPSWTDFEKLTAFFQRQFIAESRRGINTSVPNAAMVSMEALREAGSAMALLCQKLAREVLDFGSRVEEQLSLDWDDRSIGMKASDLMLNGTRSSATVVLDWAGRAQIYLPALTFAKLRERYNGPPGKLLSLMFATKVRHDTKHLVTSETPMDFTLPGETLSTLSLKAGVSSEIWCSPFSSLHGNMFWGQYADLDGLFGGFAPFSEGEGNEDILARHGGSVAATVPLDNMVASRYLHRMVDLLEVGEKSRVPISFAVFLRSDCFIDGNISPGRDDLYTLEPRLRDYSNFLVHIERLASQQHSFYSEKKNVLEKSGTGSLFVILQNGLGKSHFGISDSTVIDILRSLGVTSAIHMSNHEPLSAMSEMSFSAPEFVPAANRNKDILLGAGGLFNQSQPNPPLSPMATPNNILSDFGTTSNTDFGSFGGTAIANAFSAPVPSQPRTTRPPRGRLFDLVDDGGDDDQGTADVVSGMLGNLNMDDLFSQQPSITSNGEIDVEALSLMGIGGPPPASSSGLEPRRSRFG